VLTGRFAPDRGTVRFAGVDITGEAPRQIARRGISRSFQAMNLFDDCSALDNVILALPEVRSRGFDVWRDLRADTAAEQRAAAVLARVGLAGKEHAAPGACLTANGGRWRSRWRSPLRRASCSSTSRPPDSAPRGRRGWPSSLPS
jgi:ABC-type branched-subunit amino acid transport system ATPase component